MGEWKNQIRRGLVTILTLAVAGGMASSVSWMPPEVNSTENDSLIKISLEDIEDAVQGEAAISQEQSHAVAYASDGKGLKSNDAAIYNALKTCIQQVARGEKTSTEFSLKTRLSEAKLSQVDVNTIVSYLLNDCPFDLYWHDKTRTDENGKETDGVYCKYYKDGRIVFSFKVSQEYRNTPDDLYTVNTAYMNTVNVAVQKAKSIVETNQNNTDYDKLVNYRNAICELVYYDDTALWDPNYGNPYQIISVFDDDVYSNVVCEGYAKAFKYLCDLSHFDNDIECYTVSGVTDAGAGAGEHMWNVVRIGGRNGESYLVDVTNCDTGTIGEPAGLFMTDDLAGSVETGYSFNNGWSSITYQYSDTSREIYGNQLLSLENASHDAEAQTHVQGNNNANAPAPVSVDEPMPVAEPAAAPTEDNATDKPADNSTGQQGEGTDTATEPTSGFAFGVEKVDAVYGDDSFTETVVGYDESKKVKYKSSNEEVATVTKKGKVSIQGAGTTIITAEGEGGEKASYTLNVSPKELVWDISGLYAVDRADEIQKSTNKTATLYGEIKLEGILPGEKDENSQFSFDSSDLIGTYVDDKPGVQEVVLGWKERKGIRQLTGGKSSNYKMPESLPSLPEGKLTSIRSLSEPPESTDELKLKLEMEDGISKVPDEFLKDKTLGLNTPAKIEEKMKSRIYEDTGIPEENIVVYDVSLFWCDEAIGADTDESKSRWEPVADDEKFPEDGVTVSLPYPDQMPRNVDEIYVYHMYTADMYGTSPGQIEYCEVDETANRIQFKTYGLSPIGVAWRAADGTTQQEIPSPENINTPTQGADDNTNTGTGQQNNNNQNGQNNQNESNKSPVTGDTLQIMIYAVLIGLCGATIKGIQAVRRGNKKKH